MEMAELNCLLFGKRCAAVVHANTNASKGLPRRMSLPQDNAVATRYHFPCMRSTKQARTFLKGAAGLWVNSLSISYHSFNLRRIFESNTT